MASRFFRNTGNVNWNVTTNWSATSGGASVGAIPTASDDVFFDANSGPCTVNVAGVGLSLTFTGYANTITMTTGLTISGNVTLSTTMTVAGTAILTVNAASTLTSNGKTWGAPLTLTAAATYTFADNWTVSNFVTSTNIKTINGSTVNVTGSMSDNISTSGTTNFVLAGTGTWSGTSQLSNNVTINTAGTITVGAALSLAGNLTYVSGTFNNGGFTITFGASTAQSIDASPLTFAGVTMTNGGTITMTSDLHCTTLTQSASKVVNGSTIFCTSFLLNAGSWSGTTNITLNGTGTWSATGGGMISSTLTINAPGGTVTVSGTVGFSGGTCKYTAGTVITTGSTLQFAGTADTVDTNGMTWNNVDMAAGSVTTLTINSLLTATGTLSMSGNQKTFAGTAGFTVGSLTTSTSAGTNYLFATGNTYRVTTLFQALSTSAISHTIFKSSTSGTMATIRLDAGASCQLGYVDFTDIDASAGRVITTFNGVLSNTKNIRLTQDPSRTMAISYAA